MIEIFDWVYNDINGFWGIIVEDFKGITSLPAVYYPNYYRGNNDPVGASRVKLTGGHCLYSDIRDLKKVEI